MPTLLKDFERPAFLDPPAAGQLSLGVAAPGGEQTPAVAVTRAPFSERLRAEPTTALPCAAAAPASPDAARDGGATLDELLVGAWEGLTARRPVACPVCAGLLRPCAEVSGGSCRDCHSQLR